MVTVKIFMGFLCFPKAVPNLWNVDGEVAVTEQKPGEVAEELASSYERKLIEVRLAVPVRLPPWWLLCGLSRNSSNLSHRDGSRAIRPYPPFPTNKAKHKMVKALCLVKNT